MPIRVLAVVQPPYMRITNLLLVAGLRDPFPMSMGIIANRGWLDNVARIELVLQV